MYKKLKEAIEKVKIVDDHGHPGMYKAIDEMDFPDDAKSPFAAGFMHPKLQGYGFPYLEELHYEAYEKFLSFDRKEMDDPTKAQELTERYNKTHNDLSSFMDRIMAESNVEYFIANLYIPKELQGKSNVGLIPTVDPLVFPFNDEYMYGKPFGMFYLKHFKHILSIYKEKYGFENFSDDYTGYMKFADHVLNSMKDEGMHGYKFILAYARTTKFEKYPKSKGEELYNKAKSGDSEAYTAFQDFMAWHILRRAAENEMPVQVHMAMIDGDSEFTNPLNFTPVTMDDVACNTKLVILHCGYPRYNETTTLALAAKLFTNNNIYIDLSGRVMFGNHPKIVAKNIRNWLDYPSLWNKLIYGSDMLFGETAIYTSAKTARDAVYYALESALDDGLFGEDKAIEIGKGILRNNAIDVYRLPLEKE